MQLRKGFRGYWEIRLWQAEWLDILEIPLVEQIQLQFKEIQNNDILGSKVLLQPGQQKECYFTILIL